MSSPTLTSELAANTVRSTYPDTYIGTTSARPSVEDHHHVDLDLSRPKPAYTRRVLSPRYNTACSGRSAPSGAHQSRLVGDNDGLNPVAKAKLHQHPGDVCLDRALPDEQRRGDLGV